MTRDRNKNPEMKDDCSCQDTWLFDNLQNEGSSLTCYGPVLTSNYRPNTFFLAPDANLNGLQSAKRERVLDFDGHEVGHCSVSELDAQISDRR